MLKSEDWGSHHSLKFKSGSIGNIQPWIGFDKPVISGGITGGGGGGEGGTCPLTFFTFSVLLIKLITQRELWNRFCPHFSICPPTFRWQIPPPPVMKHWNCSNLLYTKWEGNRFHFESRWNPYEYVNWTDKCPLIRYSSGFTNYIKISDP